MKRKYQRPKILTVTILPKDDFMSQTFSATSPGTVTDTTMESNEYDDTRSYLWYDD